MPESRLQAEGVMTEVVQAWHFVGKLLRDGRPVPADGVPLIHDGPLVMCESGLHASERIIDALRYGPGSTICRVVCGGEMLRDTDKLVCRQRVILWRVKGEALLRDFARACARDVLHLWDAPDVVRQYLETGDEDIREAATRPSRMAAAVQAAAEAAWAAACAAVAGSATWAAAAAVQAWATRAAQAAAVAGTAARAAARAAAEAAARAAAEAAEAAQNERLLAMVMAARDKAEEMA
jgi:hypothetical protein